MPDQTHVCFQCSNKLNNSTLHPPPNGKHVLVNGFLQEAFKSHCMYNGYNKTTHASHCSAIQQARLLSTL